MSEDRLNDIETALAHQDKTIADLSDVINDQWKEIELLKRKLSETNDKIQDIENLGGDNNQANVKPPHWGFKLEFLFLKDKKTIKYKILP